MLKNRILRKSIFKSMIKLLHQLLWVIKDQQSLSCPHNKLKYQYCGSDELYLDKGKNTSILTPNLHINIMKNSMALTSYIKKKLLN